MRKLKRLRAGKGLTMDALEERTGVSKRTISEIERGMRVPQVLTLAKLADALGVDIDELTEEEAPKAPAPSPEVGQERRDARTLRDYVAKRVEWCEQMMDKTEGDFIYPFASLDAAIRWAMYVGIESVQLRDFITHSSAAEDNLELRALVDRVVSVSERTDARVKAMMDEDAELNAEERERVTLRLVHGQFSA